MIDIIPTMTAFTCFNTKWKKTGLSPLSLTICGLALHSRLFIEIQLNELMLMKLDKIINPTKSTFLINPNIFIYTILCFFHQKIVNILDAINISSLVNTKMIDISIKPCFFHIIY